MKCCSTLALALALARVLVLNDLYVLEQPRRQGAVSFTLSTARTHAAAQALYAATGWVRDDEFLLYNLALDR